MRTPSTLNELRRFMSSLNWEDMMGQVKQESQSRLAILGPVNAGKSTLFNALRGRNVSSTSAVPGTTRQLVADWFGPFILVDTPGFGEVDGGGSRRNRAAGNRPRGGSGILAGCGCRPAPIGPRPVPPPGCHWPAGSGGR